MEIYRKTGGRIYIKRAVDNLQSADFYHRCGNDRYVLCDVEAGIG